MQSLVQLGVCHVKFLDIFIQEPKHRLCPHRHLSIAGEEILKHLHFGFRGRIKTREG